MSTDDVRIAALSDVLHDQGSVVFWETLRQLETIQQSAPPKKPVPFLVICFVVNVDDSFHPHDLCRLIGDLLGFGSSHECSHRSSKLRRRCDGTKRALLKIPIFLFKDGKSREWSSNGRWINQRRSGPEGGSNQPQRTMSSAEHILWGGGRCEVVRRRSIHRESSDGC